MDIGKHEKDILEAALAGHDTPEACARFLFRTDQMEAGTRKEVVDQVRKVLNSSEFNRLYQRAKEDTIGTAIQSFKRTIMVNVLEMKDIAANASDIRVRQTANKDILDRVGLAPTTKTVAYTPADFEKVVEGLKKKDKGEEDPDAGTGSSGMVPPDKLHASPKPEDDGRGSGGGS